jgi:hypothetical protein
MLNAVHKEHMMGKLYYQFGAVEDSDELDNFVECNGVNYTCELQEEFEEELEARGYTGLKAERMSSDPVLYYYDKDGYVAYYDTEAQEGHMPK